MAASNMEGYYLWLSVLVSLLAIIIAWCWMQMGKKRDQAMLDEDKLLTEEIRANFNPDALHTNSNNEQYEGSNDDKCEEVEERKVERRIQQEQLKQIFKLMEKNKEKYGITSIDDIQEQVKRYKTL